MTGAATGDELCGVAYFAKPAYNVSSVSDVTSEFTGTGKGIIDTNVLANSGGSSSAGGYLQVFWIDRT